MLFVKGTLFAVGLVVLLMGIVWMGQGSGYFPYPASSFMIDQTPWIYRGAVAAVLGAVMALGSRRL